MRKNWEAREAKRPPLAERLTRAFKEYYAGDILTPRQSRLWAAFLSPEEREAEIEERRRIEEARCARLPKVVIQDDAWRARFE